MRWSMIAAFLITAVLGGCSETVPDPVEPTPQHREEPRVDTEPPREGGFHDAWLGAHLVRLEAADTPLARGRGLSGRSSLETDVGMIFIYPEADVRTFWMMDCQMDLDIAYCDDAGRIFQIGTMRAPTGDGEIDELESEAPARFVIEMASGWFAEHGVGVGESVRFSEDLERHVERIRW